MPDVPAYTLDDAPNDPVGVLLANGYKRARAERDAALAEIARLREALEQIGDLIAADNITGTGWDAIRNVARAALAEGSDGPPVASYMRRVHALEAEVSRLREALEAARAGVALVLVGHRIGQPSEKRVVDALAAIDAALAEGSDVLPTQREH